MLKRTMAVCLALALALTAGSALAQTECTVGMYADAAGTANFFQPTQGQVFNIYMILFVEDFVSAAGPYELDVPENYPGEFFTLGTFFGPSGRGLTIDLDGELGGPYNTGLGECAIGFVGFPIIVEQRTLLFPFHPQAQRTVSIVGDPDYSNCQGVVKNCDVGPDLFLDSVIATESKSFGAVKSLYGN